MAAGYSATPLAKKLGIAADSRVLLIRTPDSVLKELSSQSSATFAKSAAKPESIAVSLVMCITQKQVLADIPKSQKTMIQSGSIWVCWPKKSSGVASELTENWIRDELLRTTDLVDVKVCAIDEIWSGLKFVIRVAKRTKA